jgi:hypothetical protein
MSLEYISGNTGQDKVKDMVRKTNEVIANTIVSATTSGTTLNLINFKGDVITANTMSNDVTYLRLVDRNAPVFGDSGDNGDVVISNSTFFIYNNNNWFFSFLSQLEAVVESFQWDGSEQFGVDYYIFYYSVQPNDTYIQAMYLIENSPFRTSYNIDTWGFSYNGGEVQITIPEPGNPARPPAGEYFLSAELSNGSFVDSTSLENSLITIN